MGLLEHLDDTQLHAIVHRFYDAVFAHPRLAIFFQGVDQARQEQRLVGFVHMTGGGSPDPITAAYLRQAHAHLYITPDIFAVRAALMEAAIRGQGHGDEVVRQWRAFDGSWARHVVKTRIEDCSDAFKPIVREPDAG